ncbi:class I SAM-dependent methyltransferase [Rhodospirillum rubrum]|uniref:Class I SAM-dependent methyltransferase n=1 Tax=Rhodospirillum rubrum (strain ATCC 11170 / ATH 1.1.1 / DSM 467 / LMG 4362 / NCIMB 8255 / S1) TaxID=269796 RepID=Q2RQQ3_RHORT|nr:class I SAM-dependent methyltransferase [Rhodospirillum rubrum]ABC23542.1 conserved hypothetical protein [Rhodospirillum rubrum ATCC 11170]AEO49281.1 hypothetical protein F11_14095 [Rhodospirillum rubrum F11]MBK5955216.1 hypothetical protein [Rhodospirillum rubrum]QXG79509.1 class I SAM-dependent methyltransferase [Rhodospirillum rubrum]HAP98479.1 class I SAM-dependent methyltransferase [Rhodospirillum rubrum]
MTPPCAAPRPGGRPLTRGAAILIFPFGNSVSLDLYAEATGRGRRVICASSLAFDPARDLCTRGVWLPYYSDPDFEDHLTSLIAREGIGEIVCPHAVVWRALKERLPGFAPGVALRETDGWQRPFSGHRVADLLVASHHPGALAASGTPAALLPEHKLRAVFAQAHGIPGWCSNEKISALLDVFRWMPTGDVIEIGSWCGKSAFVLAFLARHYATGAVLCVDPWHGADIIQENQAINAAMVTFDMDEIFRVFLSTMTLVGSGFVNYRRMPSAAAAIPGTAPFSVTSAEFGETLYRGRTALLHIDGNHDIPKIEEDLRLWLPRLVPGGWLVMDDYVHAWGDGPRIIADRFVEEHWRSLDCVFVRGGALFVRLMAEGASCA